MSIRTATPDPRPAEAPAPGHRPGPAPRRGHAPEWLAAAALVAGWTIAEDRRAAPDYAWLAGGAALAFATLAAIPAGRPGLARRVALAAGRLLAVGLVLSTAGRALGAWEERAPRFGAASVAASAVLGLLGYPTAVEGGTLLIDHLEGVVTLVPTMEKLAIRPLLLFWAAWVALRLARDGRRALPASAVALAATLVAGLARFAVALAAYVEHDAILAGEAGQSALDLFESPWLTAATLVAAGWLAAVATRRLGLDGDNGGGADVAPPRRRVAAGAAVAAACGAAGLAWAFAPPGPESAGRVLVDDRFCGIWEPTARRLDDAWYGDFSTYSFTSLAEWLGHWFRVDANTSRPYDDALLAGYDVLILKTPERPIPGAEAEAIDRFVRRGGGLLLVGDHTNLLGMGTQLNALSARHGIRFRYDSVSDGAGGFVACSPPSLGRHVGALHVGSLGFLTSCSLQLSGGAEPVLAADGCRREPHDYAAPSFFGRRGPHPELAHGRTVLAATARVGRGRIAAFTDSTVWSSFAVFAHDRDALAMDLVRLLARGPSPWEGPLRLGAIGAAGLGAIGALVLARRGMALTAILLGLGGWWAGVASAEGLNRRIYALPAPGVPVPEVDFLWEGNACAFPPVLGAPSSLPSDVSFDTLLVSVQRLGLVPRVSYSYDDFLRPATRVAFVVAPVDPPPPRTADRLREFVRGGGHLVVLDDGRHADRGGARHYLGLFGIGIDYSRDHDHGPGEGGRAHVHLGSPMSPVRVPAEDVYAAAAPFGRGRVVYLSDAADFSRKGLGHCFARPWKAARARYETIFALLRDVLRVAPADRRFYGVL